MNEKANKFLNLLYPEYNQLDEKGKLEFEKNNAFIEEHIEKIESYYESIRKDPMVKESDYEVLKEAIKEAKADMFIDKLYPDYSKLDPNDKVKVARNQCFIRDNVDEVEAYYEDCMKPEIRAQNGGMTEGQIIEEAIKFIKTNQYYDLAYRDDKKAGHKDRMFILENLDKIESYYTSIRYDPMVKKSDYEVLKEAMKEAKADMFIDKLYPDYSKLDPNDKVKVARNQCFIRDNVNEVEAYYKDCMKPEIRAQNGEMTEGQIIEKAIQHIKVDRYYDLAYRDDKKKAGHKDRMFILENIDKIDRKFQSQLTDAERSGKGVNKQEIMKMVLAEVRTKSITPQQIGKATINVPTIAKREAEQVENEEMTRANIIKEGEEVGDDN